MADESNYGRNEAEEANSRVEEDNKDTVVVERDSEESEEEALVYDRSSGETSEDSGSNVRTRVLSVTARLCVVGNEQDNAIVNDATSGVVDHVQEQTEEEKGTGDKESEETKETENHIGQEEIHDGEENGDEQEEDKDGGDEEEEEDRDDDEEVEWKEEEEEEEKKVITKVIHQCCSSQVMSVDQVYYDSAVGGLTYMHDLCSITSRMTPKGERVYISQILSKA